MRSYSVFALALSLSPALADESTHQKSALCPLGDVNQDGVPDIALAGQEKNAQEHIWILSGKDGSVLHTIRGTGDGLGGSMANAGDIDEDGVDDLIVGSFSRKLPDPDAIARSSVRVFSGANGSTLFHIHAGHREESLGYCVAGVGDIDADGIPDFAASSPVGSALQRIVHSRGWVPRVDHDYRPGFVRVWSGRDGALLFQLDGRRTGTSTGEAFGISVTGIGDIDGDGRPDIAVSAPGSNCHPPTVHGSASMKGWERFLYPALEISCSGGAVRIFSGRFGTELGSFARTTPHGIHGWTLAPAGDVDGDGKPDILVGTLHRNVDVVSGATLKVIHQRKDDMFPFGDPYGFASSLSSVGDVDGDGRPDFVIGANEEFVFLDPGHVDVISGRTGALIWRFRDFVTSPRAAPFAWPRREAEPADEGYDACGIGDVDEDGTPDVAVVTQRSRRLLFLSGRDGALIRSVPISDLPG